jgi:hypothetical protein
MTLEVVNDDSKVVNYAPSGVTIWSVTLGTYFMIIIFLYVYVVQPSIV